MSDRFRIITIRPKPGIGLSVTINGKLQFKGHRTRFRSPLEPSGPHWERLGHETQAFLEAVMVEGVAMVAVTAEGAEIYPSCDYEGDYLGIAEGIQANLLGSGLMGFGDRVDLVDEAGQTTSLSFDETFGIGDVEHGKSSWTLMLVPTAIANVPGTLLMHMGDFDGAELLLFDPFQAAAARRVHALVHVMLGLGPRYHPPVDPPQPDPNP